MPKTYSVELTEQQIKNLHRILWKHKRTLETNLSVAYFEDHVTETEALDQAERLWGAVDTAQRRIQNDRIDASHHDLGESKVPFALSYEWQECDSEEARTYYSLGYQVRSMEWNRDEYIVRDSSNGVTWDEHGVSLSAYDIAGIEKNWDETGWEVRFAPDSAVNTEAVNDR